MRKNNMYIIMQVLGEIKGPTAIKKKIETGNNNLENITNKYNKTVRDIAEIRDQI